ncbi:hypothetical protein, variant [Verruconis gallopava]|uniref:Uncharacterized protein n=1 Tax=Verruconis gallopava TaxID=253628 RepID=A0A0D1XAL3_9PEZI|nr:hypothetical protein, variant [Verruconis gallopava]KIV99250.1 hypothetical protein, variant [Verruconis gallopava]
MICPTASDQPSVLFSNHKHKHFLSSSSLAMSSPNTQKQALLDSELANLAFRSTLAVRRAAFKEEVPRLPRPTGPQSSTGTQCFITSPSTSVRHADSSYRNLIHDSISVSRPSSITIRAAVEPISGSAYASPRARVPRSPVQSNLSQPEQRPGNKFQTDSTNRKKPKKKQKSASSTLSTNLPPPPSRFYDEDGNFRLTSEQQTKKGVGALGSAPTRNCLPLTSRSKPPPKSNERKNSKHSFSENEPGSPWA